MDLVHPRAKDPKLRRAGEPAAQFSKAYACFEHTHTTPESDVLFPAIQLAPLGTPPRE